MPAISPMDYAKKIGKRPQVVYGWIRKQGLPAFKDEKTGKLMLDEEVADRWVAERESKTPQERAAEARTTPTLKEKQIIRYERLPDTKLQSIAQVQKWDPYDSLVFVKKSNGHDFPFTPESLRERIKKGEIIVEDPENVLIFVIQEYEARGKTEIATALRQVCERFGIKEVPPTKDGRELSWEMIEEGFKAVGKRLV